jgi:hypothetical protein
MRIPEDPREGIAKPPMPDETFFTDQQWIESVCGEGKTWSVSEFAGVPGKRTRLPVGYRRYEGSTQLGENAGLPCAEGKIDTFLAFE